MLAAEVGDEPKKERKHDAEEQASDDGEVESGVFALMDDVTGEFSDAEGKPVPEIEKDADQNKKRSEEDKRASEFAKRIHEVIVPEGAASLSCSPIYYY